MRMAAAADLVTRTLNRRFVKHIQHAAQAAAQLEWPRASHELVVGAVPGLGNVDPAGYVGLYDALVAGDYAEARRKQERLVRLGKIRSQGKRPAVGTTAALAIPSTVSALGLVVVSLS